MNHYLYPLILFLCLGSLTQLHGQSAPENLFDHFDADWRDHWRRKSFTLRANTFEVVQNGTDRALKIESKNSATGLWRDIEIIPQKGTQLSWRWKTDHYLRNRMEMKKNGDDFVGRVYVAFGEYSWLNRKRLSVICYVWASDAKANSIFPSPYADNVKIMVLRDQTSTVGQWHQESRNLLADYQKCFGGTPMPVSAIGIMVDTDNTDMESTSWFTDLSLRR